MRAHFVRYAILAFAGGVLFHQTPASLAQTNGPVATSPIVGLDIEGKINQALAELEVVQGLSIAIYTPQGSYVQGFGVTDIETKEAVTKETAFYIASSTKSMFALAMSVLHERGELDLDQSLSEFAPTAPFPRRIRAEKIKLRNLLTMSSGIKNSAYVHRVALSGEHTPDLLWSLIGKTQLNQARDIRLGHFRYTNWNYNLMARLVEEKFENSWQNILAEEIFQKVGMTHATAYMSQAQNENWSLARPHITLGPDAPARTYLEKTDTTMQSAGGVIMSAEDAVKWLEVLVENGKLGGEQVFSTTAVQATRQPLTVADTVYSGRYPYIRDHYGLGWYIGPYGEDQHMLVHHFGGFSGARAHVSYMPEQKIGVAIFVNDSGVGSGLIDLVANYVYDTLIGHTDAATVFETGIDSLDDWGDDLTLRIDALRANIATREWSLNQPMGAYAGTYVNSEFGTITVTVESNTLRVINGNLTAVAQAGTKPETVRVEFIPLEGGTISFKLDRHGNVKLLIYDRAKFRRQ